MDQNRVRLLKSGKTGSGPVVYWMSRDQRVKDNWALLFSQELALRKKERLAVIFCLVPSFLEATLRQYSFMLDGLRQVEKDLKRKNIPFFLLAGSPEVLIPEFVRTYAVGALVADFDPLKVKREWKELVSRDIDIPLYEVDAHNVVPCWVASPKQEYAAYTFRPKVKRALGGFLEEFPKLKAHPFSWDNGDNRTDWLGVADRLQVDRAVSQISWIEPGERAAQNALRDFVENKLASYDSARNDPTASGQSDLSPYLHFGQISAQRVALEVNRFSMDELARQEFLEELIIRRELSDNYCFYNSNYDSVAGFPSWARVTLEQHAKDKRTYTYSVEQFENGQTHDELWNAAQMEMVKIGKMHGYMRMYWAKKILEWTQSPEEALEVAILLNDKYELDGRDPNGYVGCAWSIGGVHDRAWFERPIFGKIRYMSYKGCKSKFDVESYIQKIREL